VMLYNTQMVGASPNRYLPSARRKRFRQATTRSLGTRRICRGFFLLFFSCYVWDLGFGLWERGGTVEVVIIVYDHDKRRLLTP